MSNLVPGPKWHRLSDEERFAAYAEAIATLESVVDELPEHNPQYPPFESLDECPPVDPRGCGNCETIRNVRAIIARAKGDA